jgi:hypothetical protein
VVIVNLAEKTQPVALHVGQVACDCADIFTTEPCRLAARANVELAPWAFKVHVTGTPQPAARTP